jgi:membrane protein insertase Oxa1/YidC/SpoIIIJ
MYEVVQRVNATSTVTVNGAVGVTMAGDFALSDTKVFGVFEMTTSFFNAAEVKDKIFGLVIALLFGGVTFLQQKLGQRPLKYQKKYNDAKNKKQTDQQNQMKWMMIIMNVMFVFMSLSSTSLGIYWLIGGVYQIGQSQIGRMINERNYEKHKRNDIIG